MSKVSFRRQLPDLEDTLIHAHGETPETARLKVTMTPSAERERLIADYHTMEDKPAFTPWQVSQAVAYQVPVAILAPSTRPGPSHCSADFKFQLIL